MLLKACGSFSTGKARPGILREEQATHPSAIEWKPPLSKVAFAARKVLRLVGPFGVGVKPASSGYSKRSHFSAPSARGEALFVKRSDTVKHSSLVKSGPVFPGGTEPNGVCEEAHPRETKCRVCTCCRFQLLASVSD